MLNSMNGFLIEVRPALQAGRRTSGATVWIGIAGSSAEMIARMPPGHPSVVDRGDRVLKIAMRLGLQPGEIRSYVE